MYQPLLPQPGEQVTIGGRTHKLGTLEVRADPATGRITRALASCLTHGYRWLDLVPWLERDRLSLEAAHEDARRTLDLRDTRRAADPHANPAIDGVNWPSWAEYRAGCIGAEHGRNAASYLFDGNTPTETYRAFAAGIADGDPEYLNRIPVPDLSCGWADGYTPRQLLADVGGNDGDAAFYGNELMDPLCDAYEQAFTRAAQDAAERTCRAHLQDENARS